MEKILLIEGIPRSLSDLEPFLRQRHDLVVAHSVKCGVDILQSQHPSAILLDYSYLHRCAPGMIRLVSQEIDPDTPIIVIADDADIGGVVEAMREGAYDVLPSDHCASALSDKILKVIDRWKREKELKNSACGFRSEQKGLVFASESMRRINFEITRLARLDCDVLLLGETGVGKDLVAGEIYRRGSRSGKPFIPLPLQTLSETLIESEIFGHEKGAFSGADRTKMGKFEAANGGTVYLPEISTLSESVQLKLLSFMQYKTISRIGQDPRKAEVRLNVRLITASNEKLEELVKRGGLRQDFYYRITGVRLEIPPLRERPEDIEPLALHFCEKYSPGRDGAVPRLDHDALRLLKAHGWPGNVRELENQIRQALVLAGDGTLHRDHFPLLGTASHVMSIPPASPNGQHDVPTYAEAEILFKRSYFQDLLNRSNGNITRAARLASLTPQGVRKILSHIALH